MYRTAQVLFLAVSLLFITGCGGQTPTSGPPRVGDPLIALAPASLTITDIPPAGVTVLFFGLNVTGASLNYQSWAPNTTSLFSLSNPILVEVTRLQTESAFLDSASVAVFNGESTPTNATFDGLTVTLSNPELTIYNGTGATLGSGAHACASNSVCQLITPSTTPLTLTFAGAPFPLSYSAKSSPLSFLLDVHLNTVIQPGLSVNLAAANGVTLSQLPYSSSADAVTGLGFVTGTITALDPAVNSLNLNGFTLQTTDGRTYVIDVTSSTAFNSFPTAACSTGGYACLATQQVVRAGLNLNGTFLASEVDYVQTAGQTLAEGIITGLSSSGGNTLMNLVLQRLPTVSSALAPGQAVTVTVPPSGVDYAVDSAGFAIPGGLTFAGASDLTVGQEVSVVVPATATASGFTTNGITLEPSPITGTVTSINAGGLSFVLSADTNFFAPLSAGNPGITVQTAAATSFINLANIQGLAVNDMVSVAGWVFSTPNAQTPITQVGETVIYRPGPTPLF